MRSLRVPTGTVRWLIAGSVVALAASWALAGARPAPAGLSAEEKADLARQFDAARKVGPVEQYELTAKYDREFARSVAHCMGQSGWSYVAYVPAGPPPPGLGQPPEQYARQYGFGITTTLEHHSAAVPDADPNAGIRARLTEDELAAYRRTHQQCDAAARRTIPLPTGTMLTSDAANDALQQVQRQVDADPRVHAATADWSRCMTIAGFPAARPEDLRHQLRQRLEPLLPPHQAQPLELERLQSFERSAALADHRCGASLRLLTEKLYGEKIDQLLATG